MFTNNICHINNYKQGAKSGENRIKKYYHNIKSSKHIILQDSLKEYLEEWLGVCQVEIAVQVGGMMTEMAPCEKERRGRI